MKFASWSILGLACCGCGSSAQPVSPTVPEAQEPQVEPSCSCPDAEPRGDGSEAPVATPEPTPPPSEPFAAFPNNRDAAYLNDRLDAVKPNWATIPTALALHALGEGASGVASVEVKSLTAEGKPTREYPARAVVIVVVDELDDSIRQTRWTFNLERAAEGSFRYGAVETAVSCAPGRGHQAFSKEPCR